MGVQNQVVDAMRVGFGPEAGLAPDERLANRLTKVAALVLGLVAVGLAVVLAGAGCRTVAIMWALATLACGGGAGFLFGVPRIVQGGAMPPAVSVARTPDAAPAYRQYVNTNLQDVSDWLTKILIGVGLTQYQTLADQFRRAADLLARGLGGDWAGAADEAFAQGLMVYFAAVGAFGGYLLTRLALAGLFRTVDTAVEDLERRVEAAKADLRQAVVAVRSEVEVVKVMAAHSLRTARPGPPLSGDAATPAG